MSEVTWEEPALFDAPATHMPVPLAVRAMVNTHNDRCQRAMLIPLTAEHLPSLTSAAIEGDVEWVDDYIDQHVDGYHAGARVSREELGRLMRALVERRTMPIPGGAR